MEAEQGFQGGDQGAPLLALLDGAVGERGGRDDGEPAGDLAAADSGEQALGLNLDAGVNEGGGQPAVILSRNLIMACKLRRCDEDSVVDGPGWAIVQDGLMIFEEFLFGVS
jgi:hypothetical protein